MPSSNGQVVNAFYAVVNPQGVIMRMGTNDVSLIAIQATDESETVISDLDEPSWGVIRAEFPESLDDRLHYWLDGAWAEYPARPGHWAEWDGVQWIDPRTPVDLQGLLYAARDAAFLDKTDLLTAMLTMGLMDMDNVLIASEGNIPPLLEPHLAALPVEVQAIARIKWRNDTRISRMNPVILLAAAVLNISAEQMDDLFAVQTPI